MLSLYLGYYIYCWLLGSIVSFLRYIFGKRVWLKVGSSYLVSLDVYFILLIDFIF